MSISERPAGRASVAVSLIRQVLDKAGPALLPIAVERLARGVPNGRNVGLELRLASRGWGNRAWASTMAYLVAALDALGSTEGPIVECGSGFSTLVLGAATRESRRKVTSFEDSPHWEARVRRYLARHGCDHVTIVDAAIADFGDFAWYGVGPGAVPSGWGLAICDGPPGSRKGG